VAILPTSHILAKSEDIANIDYLIDVFKNNGYYVTPNKMCAPVGIYDFVKRDILSSELMGKLWRPIEMNEPVVAVEASCIRYENIDDLLRWIELDKAITPNRIFIPYKSGNTKFAMPSPDDRKTPYFEDFNFVRGVWFNPEQTKAYKKYYSIS
jgi:hypothetical protein